jgi:hypothetical protein
MHRKKKVNQPLKMNILIQLSISEHKAQAFGDDRVPYGLFRLNIIYFKPGTVQLQNGRLTA